MTPAVEVELAAAAASKILVEKRPLLGKGEAFFTNEAYLSSICTICWAIFV